MAYGAMFFDAAGVTVFDSRLAVGGVCVGFYTVPTGGGVISFPDMVGTTGIVLAGMLGGPINSAVCVVDSALGYPRFTFSAGASGFTYCLFVK